MASIKLKGDTSGEVTISAPSVAGTTTLELPATSSTLATQNSLGVRNLIINGDMRINQRGDTTGANGSGYFGVDRWNTEEVGLGTYDVEQDTDVPSGQGFANSLKISLATTETVASGDFLRFAQRIEGQNLQHLKFGTSSAESITLSFWIKSNLTGTYALSFQSIDGVSTNRLIGTTYTIDSADTWEKKTLTFVGDTAQVIRNDNGLGLRMFWWLVAGSNYKGTNNTSWIAQVTDAFATGHNVDFNSSTSNYINITGVQLEAGTEATPFENRPYDMELQRCQRYFEVREVFAGSYITPSFAVNATQTSGMIFYHTKKRAIPSLSYTGAVGGFSIQKNASVYVATVVQFGNLGVDSSAINIYIGTSSMTASDAVRCRGNGTREIHISAEL